MTLTTAADSEMSLLLFSYGTLQLRDVQLATYGRELQGEFDMLTGYRLDNLAITDPDVVRISGTAMHTIARPSNDPSDRIAGTVFALTDAELAATDTYEVDGYIRVKATLASGRTAWVYVGPPLGD